MENIIFDITLEGHHFEGFASNLVISFESKIEIEASELKILDNSKRKNHFGETFAGYKLDADDFLYKVISAYVNNETYLTFNYIHPMIEEELKSNIFKSSWTSYKSNRHIPQFILNSDLEKLELDGLWEYNGFEYAAYVGVDNEAVMLCNADDGMLITSYECFYISGITEDCCKEGYNLIYASENFKLVLKDYDIDLDNLITAKEDI